MSIKTMKEVIKQEYEIKEWHPLFYRDLASTLKAEGYIHISKVGDPDFECAFCCHENEEVLKKWFVKWAEDNGYFQAPDRGMSVGEIIEFMSELELETSDGQCFTPANAFSFNKKCIRDFAQAIHAKLQAQKGEMDGV